MTHVDKAEGQHYRDQLLAKIIDICSQDNYHFITNFDWLVVITFKHNYLKLGNFL